MSENLKRDEESSIESIELKLRFKKMVDDGRERKFFEWKPAQKCEKLSTEFVVVMKIQLWISVRTKQSVYNTTKYFLR